VFVLEQNGLSAALSELEESDMNPDVPRVLAYEAVVEYLYRDLTVIPVRFGCQFAGAPQALRFLETHADEYGSLLGKLEGLGEMGIHILLDNAALGSKGDAQTAAPKPVSGKSGAAYLASKRERYLGLDRIALEERVLVEELWNSLAGLYVRRKVESPGAKGSHLLSMNFLVPRTSVESFRLAARQFRSKSPGKLLLSGPWPPYNFVDSIAG
jgi:hypothetical protein